MTDQPKSPFSFGTSATGGASGTLFGQPNSASQPSGSLFGSTNTLTATSAPGLFGTSTTTGGGSIFGGAGESGNASSSIFGQAQSTAAQQPGTSASFHNFATPNKPANSTNTVSGQSSNILGGGVSSLFQNAASSASATAATPASKPTISFPPLGSTTPADPPPSSQAGGSSAFSLNLNNQQQEKKTFFPSLSGSTSANPASSQTATAPSQTATSSGFGFFADLGKPQSSSSIQPPASTRGSGLFTNFGSQTSAAQSGGQAASASIFTKPLQSSAAEAQKPTFSFPLASSQSSTQDAQKAQTSAPSLFSLGASTKPPTDPSSAPSTNIFGSFGKSTDTTKSTASTAAGVPTSMFSNLGKAQEAPVTSASAINTSSQAPALATAPTSSFLGKPNQPPSPNLLSQSNVAATTNKSETQGSVGTAAGGTLGQSTSGPAPSAQSRLKNKSMDEIITRWASDLAKYQKEFQRQAEKVAAWDHMLVENSEKIQRLYGSTLEAERATAEVERQITAVENDQNELESWLDRYEEKVDQMISNSGDSFHGPDLERERTYQLAEKLSSRLDEMGKDLGSMIEEINDVSSNLNKNTKPDDPLSHVVRVLNSHLTQLQQIDQGAAALQLKVAAAQKASQTLNPANGLNGPSSDAADSFYRSFMSRR